MADQETVDRHARAEITAIRGELGAVNSSLGEIYTKINDQGGILTTKISDLSGILTEVRTEMRSNKPQGIMDMLKAGIIFGLFVGTLIGGVGYVVSATSESRIALLEYRMTQMEHPTVNRYVVSTHMKSARE